MTRYSQNKKRGAKKSAGTEKRKKIIRLVFIIIGFISIITALGFVSWKLVKRYYEKMSVYESFTLGYAPGDKTMQQANISTERNCNILFVGIDRKESGHIKNDFSVLVSYNAADQVFNVINIPVKIFYYSSLGDSYYQLQNLYALGQIEVPESGLTKTISLIEENLALKIDGYVVLDFEGARSLSGTLGNLHFDNPSPFEDEDLSMNSPEFLKNGSITLNDGFLWEYVRADAGGFIDQSKRHDAVIKALANKISLQIGYSLVFDNQSISNHLFSNITADTLRSFAEIVYEKRSKAIKNFLVSFDMMETGVVDDRNVELFNASGFDNDFTSISDFEEIEKEQGRVEIYNATSINGLAYSLSRFMKNVGIDVIRTASYEGSSDNTIIYVQDPSKYTKTIVELKKILPNSQVVTDATPFLATGDIVVIVGDNL